MAVQLRCPHCRAKLRLPEAPEPDSEVECPECGDVFPGEENIIRAGGADENDKPRKKKASDNADGKSSKNPEVKQKTKKLKKKGGEKGADLPKPKRKKSKKRKTSPIVLGLIIAGALLVVGGVGGVLIWFFTKKSASQEMMSYLPAECDQVFGLNLGHLQKYPAFYRSCETSFEGKGFRKAADVFSAALGLEFKDTIDYIVQGSGRVGGVPTGKPLGATVMRTKAEYDQAAIAKIPGAKEFALAGTKYYVIPDIPQLGYPGLRVFAPTNRIVVFCRGDMPEATFKSMLGANQDNIDATAFVRSESLGKYTIRGTVWNFVLYDKSVPRPAVPSKPKGPAAGELSDEDQFQTEIAGLAASAKGASIKASVGSREVRGEWTIMYKDSDGASENLKKWRDKEWMKDSEKDPPRWWKNVANRSGGGKTAPQVLRDNLAFTSSGPLLTVRTAMEVKLLENSVSTIVNAFTEGQGGGGSGADPGADPGGGVPPPPGGGPGVVPGPGGGVVIPP